MSNKAFVYKGTIKESELKRLFEALGEESTYFIWTVKQFIAGEGIPQDFGESGTLFNKKLEIKWQRNRENNFNILILSDIELKETYLQRVSSNWETKEEKVLLFSLDEKSISPQIKEYPKVKDVKAALKCKIFYRDGIAIFMSPREVIRNE